jgi:hypothetical protein
VHWANLHAGHAIDAVVGMNHDLAIHFVEARDGTDFYAVGEFASITFLGHNMGHSVSVINSGLGEKTLLRVLSHVRESNFWFSLSVCRGLPALPIGNAFAVRW